MNSVSPSRKRSVLDWIVIGYIAISITGIVLGTIIPRVIVFGRSRLTSVIHTQRQ